MEVNSSTTVPAGPPTISTKNHTFIHHYHHLHSEKDYHNHVGHFPFKTIIIIITMVALIMLLFTIFLVVCLIRRQKSSSKNGVCKDDCESRVLHDTSRRHIAPTILSFDSSPGNSMLISINCNHVLTWPNRYNICKFYELLSKL